MDNFQINLEAAGTRHSYLHYMWYVVKVVSITLLTPGRLPFPLKLASFACLNAWQMLPFCMKSSIFSQEWLNCTIKQICKPVYRTDENLQTKLFTTVLSHQMAHYKHHHLVPLEVPALQVLTRMSEWLGRIQPAADLHRSERFPSFDWVKLQKKWRHYMNGYLTTNGYENKNPKGNTDDHGDDHFLYELRIFYSLAVMWKDFLSIQTLG